MLIPEWLCWLLGGHNYFKEYRIDATKNPIEKTLLFVECERCLKRKKQFKGASNGK